ncbi:sensor domain-containing diguanylate cyclase [Blautia schinkii]|nr:sensor domain-containing diguanylate cyclase [Blautia schinkii]
MSEKIKVKKILKSISYRYIAAFLIVNIIAAVFIVRRESEHVDNSLYAHGTQAKEQVEQVLDDYRHSFELFSQMMSQEIKNNPDPDDIWDYLKSIDATMLEIEGDTFDGLYMYYKGRYLYSWDTPYSEYEDTGYVATERPWYKDAVASGGEIVFTPPYMSYANHYILSTISQLQPDGETVFAYDIRMGDIQNLVSTVQSFDQEQMMIFDNNGTVIGSTNELYLGGSLTSELEDTAQTVKAVQTALDNADGDEQADKLRDELEAAEAFHSFRESFGIELARLLENEYNVQSIKLNGKSYYGCVIRGRDYHFLLLVPVLSMLKDTVAIWLLPILIIELLLVYILGRVSKEQRNRELKEAYIELGQTQKRLEIALSAAQKAAAIDELTGMMNFGSFRKGVTQILENMCPEERGILIMIDGDHFKLINDNYGHQIGDEVIKLSAQMIIGRIRTVDLASRLHGDEFAIFVSDTDDYSVAKRIMEDINHTLAKEAQRRNMPSITMSAGAVTARHGDTYLALAKVADAALYEAKVTHNGGFAWKDMTRKENK